MAEEIQTAELEMLEPFSEERAAAKERIRLMYVSGRSTLAALALKEKIPLNTVQRWSSAEKWHVVKADVQHQGDRKLVSNIVDWVTEQREVQIKRAISRAAKLQSKADELLPDVMEASELQAIAAAEEKADNIVRRNLGMDQQNTGSGSVSINILANGIQLS